MIQKQSDLNTYADQGYNRVPIVGEVLADLETPLSTYRKLAGQPYSFLFESVQGGEKWGRYSIIGLPCSTRITIKDFQLQVVEYGEVIRDEKVSDPLSEIEAFQAQYRVPEIDGLPRFYGGLVGYFGFDTVHYIEPHFKPNTKLDEVNAPDILLMVAEEVIVFDNLSGRLFVVAHVDPHDDNAFAHGQKRIADIMRQLDQALPPRPFKARQRAIKESDFTSSFQERPFLEAVETCKQYIVNGDIFQVVISQHMSTDFDADPLDLYRALRTLNPSPYMYYLDLEDFHIAGSSPEILVRLEDKEVTVRPIAGTRRRGHTEEEDLAMEAELLSDPKELAEHLMLVDLGRNDAGRVSKIGTVKVTEREIIERYSHVMHIVSNVTGELKDKLTAMDVLRATFPAGTVSGAPKIRAMEIIEELEPVKRGIYSGAIGYIGWNGNMDTAIGIRTAIVHNNTLHIQAGAGIVADSVPALEWKETLNKGRAVFKAAALAQSGLNINQHR